MIMKTLLNEKQYKVNLHAHTSISDGCLSPEEIKRYYMEQGYHAVAFTDHGVLVPHEHLTDAHFVALHGYEYAVMREKGGPCYHMNLIARTPSVRAQVMFCEDSLRGNAKNYVPSVSYVGKIETAEYSLAYINRLIDAAHRAGYLVQYNHPVWSLQSYPDYAGLEGIDLLEVFNTCCIRTTLPDRDDRVLQDMCLLGKFPMPTGGDDNHNSEPFDSPECDSFGAFTMLCADSLTYGGLIDALENGNGYASEGPIIRSLACHDGVLYGEVSPAVTVRIQGAGRRGTVLHAPAKDSLITHFRVPFDASFEYLRLTVEDASGKRAYTRAYKMEEVLS